LAQIYIGKKKLSEISAMKGKGTSVDVWQFSSEMQQTYLNRSNARDFHAIFPCLSAYSLRQNEELCGE
jgi:hypothetical protein